MHYGEPVEKHEKFQLWLYLAKRGDGHNYQWQDGHGKLWCTGFCAGAKKKTIKKARKHLEEVLGWPEEIE